MLIKVYALVNRHGKIMDAFVGKQIANMRKEYLTDKEDYKIHHKQMKKRDRQSPFTIVRCKGVFKNENLS